MGLSAVLEEVAAQNHNEQIKDLIEDDPETDTALLQVKSVKISQYSYLVKNIFPSYVLHDY